METHLEIDNAGKTQIMQDINKRTRILTTSTDLDEPKLHRYLYSDSASPNDVYTMQEECDANYLMTQFRR